MAKKEFQAESKKLMDMMINSIYTNKEIFLRELISNASDAIDKLYYKSLTDTSVGMNKSDFHILITRDKENRILTVEDNGIGMTKAELEENLGTIAHSGSLDFKQDNKDENIDIIGQFGVGFYSSFMVADKVTVISKAYGSDEAWQWESSGVDGYEMTPAEKDTAGTQIILHIKPDTETDHYDNFLDEYGIVAIVKKYSDYVRYPIQMEREKSRQKPEPDPKPDDYKPEWETYTELETLNSMVPIWKKQKSEVTDEEYANFYKDKFSDYADPARVIVSRTEGTANYNALLFVPSHRPYDFYTKDYEKGLALYASGVLIMEKCGDLLPDYFSFVKGIVDSQDLSLNISREMLQKDNQLKLIHNALEKKIKNELHAMLANDREKYEQFHAAFGMVLRAGANTGGSDTIGQIISRNTSLPVGSTVMAIDVAVCALSAPVFSIENALYAGLSMVISGYVIDAVVDGGNKRRMVLIISDKFPDIAADIMYGLGRGCTKFKATGMYSGAEKPVIMVIVNRRELNTLKTIVRERDPHAIVTVADVTEAFGEGFKDISA